MELYLSSRRGSPLTVFLLPPSESESKAERSGTETVANGSAAPRYSDGGLEAVCLVSFGGDGENGLEGREKVCLLEDVSGVVGAEGPEPPEDMSGRKGIKGIGRWKM